MRWSLALLRSILFLIMALLLAESESHYIQKYIAKWLHKEGISFRCTPLALNDYIFEDIRYKEKSIAKSVHIRFELLPLFNLDFIVDELEISHLRLKNILPLIQHRSRSSATQPPSWHILIKHAKVTATYPYRGENSALLVATDITTSSANIETLRIHSFTGVLDAHGSYRAPALHLEGSLHPKVLKGLHIAPARFSLQADPKNAHCTITEPLAKYKEFNLTHALIEATSDYKSLKATLTASLAHPKLTSSIQARFDYDERLRYQAKARLHLAPIAKDLRYESYKKLSLHIQGDLDRATITLSNENLHIDAEVNRSRHFRLRTSTIRFQKFYPLPEPIQDFTLRLEANGTLKSFTFGIDSNYLLARGDYQQRALRATIDLQRSLGSLNLPALNPIRVAASPTHAKIDSPLLKADILTDRATITLPDASIECKKRANTIDFVVSIDSLARFFQNLQALYPVPKSPIQSPLRIDGAFNLASKRFHAHILTPPNPATPFQYADIQLHGTPKALTIDYYALVLKGHGLYATKPSHLRRKGSKLFVDLWIEDRATLEGTYDLTEKDGTFRLQSPRFNYSGAEGEIKTAFDIAITTKANHVKASGNIQLLGGILTYEPKKRRSIEDKDIVIIDKNIQTHNSDFFKNFVSLDIHIGAKTPILYKIPDLYALIVPDLLLYKEEQKSLELLGVLKILKGHYEIADGYFDIAPSTLNFYGPPTSPLLDLHLTTRKSGYLIYISVSGDTQNPILSFDSEPYLKPNEILSLLIFGSSSKAIFGALGGNRFTSMLSNLFIKDLFAQMGIKLDTLSLITSGNRFGFEIGKRISDRITIVYKNDEISTLIIRYRLSDHLESEAIFGPDRSGIHIYYRNLK